MANLVLNHIEPDLVTRLEQRATSHGVSPEQEHLNILRQSLKFETEGTDQNKFQVLRELLFDMPDAGVDADFERDQELPRELDLS
jgi:plasmid stability protein